MFLALYLKQCASSLQIAYGGDRRPHDRLPVPVSLTRSGFPRIIQFFIRRQMYKKDDKADMLVKILLSLFNLSKIILLAKRMDFSTFASIVSRSRKGGPSRQPGGGNAAPVGGEVPTLGFTDPP